MASAKWLAEVSFGRRSSLNQLDLVNQFFRSSTPKVKSSQWKDISAEGKIFQLSPVRGSKEESFDLEPKKGFLRLGTENRRASCGPTLMNSPEL